MPLVEHPVIFEERSVTQDDGKARAGMANWSAASEGGSKMTRWQTVMNRWSLLVVLLALLAAAAAARPTRLLAFVLPFWEQPIMAMISPQNSAGSPAYPLKASANKRYLVDQNNVPFLMSGDSPQGLLHLSSSDLDYYLSSRQAAGVNAIWADALCSPYSNICPDIYTSLGSSVPPFTGTLGDGNYDLSTPNYNYFAQVDQMVGEAAKYGMVVLLDPIETGYWLPTIDSNYAQPGANGYSKAYNYGVYLGTRYKDHPNIIWLHGNDFQSWSNSTDDAAVSAVAQGIESVDAVHLQTVELDYPDSGSLEDGTWATIVGLDAAYSYYPEYNRVLTEYKRDLAPVYFIEGEYEEQNNPSCYAYGTYNGLHDLRAQEYWTQLSGTTGQLYGNTCIFTFSTNWKNYLNDPGFVQFQYMNNFFAARPWYNLVPDQTHAVFTGGLGTYDNNSDMGNTSDYVTGAKTCDGTLGIAYIPSAHSTGALTVDMTKFAGTVNARWFDPTTGAYTTIGSIANTNTAQRFTPPAVSHSDGTNDWVLVLEVSSSPSVTPGPRSCSLYLPAVINGTR